MNHSNGNSTRGPYEDSRPVAIRAGLSVQELKMMTAMRMAQNSSDHQPSHQANTSVHNPSSSYQTANPQQLRAAGIQPVVINDRTARSHRHTAGRSLQLAGQFSAEQYSGQFSNNQARTQSMQTQEGYANYPSAKHRGASSIDPLPAVSARQQELPSRRRMENAYPSQQNNIVSPTTGRFSVHGENSFSRVAHNNANDGLYDDFLVNNANFEPTLRTTAFLAEDAHSRHLTGGLLAPPSSRSNSVATLHHPQNNQNHHHHLYSAFHPPQQKSYLPADELYASDGFSASGAALRSPLHSAGGRPEVLSNDDEFHAVVSGRQPARGTQQQSATMFLDPFSAQFESDLTLEANKSDWLSDSGSSHKYADVNGKKVSLLKSRSEALFPADQLAFLQQGSRVQSNFSLPDVDSPRSSGMYSVASETLLNAAPAPFDLTDSPTKSRFPLLKSKTAPKISGVQFVGNTESPSGSPSLKLFGRKKGSPGPNNDMFLASEVAESVLGNTFMDGDLFESRQQPQQQRPRMDVESDRLFDFPINSNNNNIIEPKRNALVGLNDFLLRDSSSQVDSYGSGH